MTMIRLNDQDYANAQRLIDAASSVLPVFDWGKNTSFSYAGSFKEDDFDSVINKRSMDGVLLHMLAYCFAERRVLGPIGSHPEDAEDINVVWLPSLPIVLMSVYSALILTGYPDSVNKIKDALHKLEQDPLTNDAAASAVGAVLQTFDKASEALVNNTKMARVRARNIFTASIVDNIKDEEEFIMKALAKVSKLNKDELSRAVDEYIKKKYPTKESA